MVGMVYIWFNVLTDLFDWVGICTNMRRTVRITYQPWYIPGGFSELAYTQKVTGIGPSYQEILRRRVECPECRVGLVAGYLLTYIQVQHSVVRGGQGQPQPPPPGEAQTYQVSYPTALTRLRFPVEG